MEFERIHIQCFAKLPMLKRGEYELWEMLVLLPKGNTASIENLYLLAFSDAIVYAFLSTQPKGSQLVHEDLEQLHDDDLEEMDLKWNMAL
ncbi:hypothetical protein Tco_0358933 [Tanacetum coccineum]